MRSTPDVIDICDLSQSPSQQNCYRVGLEYNSRVLQQSTDTRKYSSEIQVKFKFVTLICQQSPEIAESLNVIEMRFLAILKYPDEFGRVSWRNG